MQTLFWETKFNNSTQVHCQLVIEEIEITNPSDKKKAEKLTDINDHNAVRKLALKYTANKLFKQAVTRISELDKIDLLPNEEAEHQELVKFVNHYFRVKY